MRPFTAIGDVHLRTPLQVSLVGREDGLWRIEAGNETFEARALVNAAGPGVIEVEGLLGEAPDYAMRLVRGSHIVVTTIMFNFIASSLLVYLLVNQAWCDVMGKTPDEVIGQPPGEVQQWLAASGRDAALRAPQTLTVLPLLAERNLLVRRLYREADVVHLRNNLSGWQKLDAGAGKLLFQVAGQRQRQHDVAEVRKRDDEDLHPTTSSVRVRGPIAQQSLR
mgnify:CR=1 FL=1